jgi:hypothetical protein
MLRYSQRHHIQLQPKPRSQPGTHICQFGRKTSTDELFRMIQAILPELREDKFGNVGIEVLSRDMESMFQKVQRIDCVSDCDYKVNIMLVDFFRGDAGVSDLSRQRWAVVDGTTGYL